MNDTNQIVIIKENGERIVNQPSIDGLNIIMRNSNNTLTIYEPFHFYGVTIDLNGDIDVNIEKNCTMSAGCSIKKTRNRSFNKLVIGKNFSCGRNCTIDLTDSGNILIGDDAKWSWNIYVKSDDAHPVYDINTKDCLNKSSEVVIGNHVWIGMNATILKNSKIKENSVIGACSVVAKKFEEGNVVIAGNPAQICKRNINWAHGSINTYIQQRKDNKMKKVGIIGCGVIGGALKKWLEDNTDHKIFVSDPPKGYNDDMSVCDVFFVQIHIPTEQDGTQNLSVLESIIANLPDKPIFVRTTILPGTSDKLSRKFNKHVYFMPEFLTERTSVDDFKTQPMVFTAETELLKNIFPNKEYIEMSSLEAEITKYAHNVFGALKVTYFNAIYDYCQKLGANFSKVHTGCLLSGYINDTHTQVPGPDGNFGYGGKCFPKDVDAFSEATKSFPLGVLLKPLHQLNEKFRN